MEEGTYTIVNVKGGTGLDLSGGDNYSIIGFEAHGQGNQQWYVHQQDCGYTIRCVSSGLLLNYEGHELRDGLKVIANEEERVWEIYPDEEHGGFRIQAPGTPFNVDLSNNGDSGDGTPVELWGKWDAANQVWHFNRVDE